jgi:hypothetical protein
MFTIKKNCLIYMNTFKITLFFFGLFLFLTFTSCDNRSKSEKAFDELSEKAKETADEVKEAGEETGKETKKKGKKTKKKLKDFLK